MPTPQVSFGCSLGGEENWDVAELARKAEAMGFDRVTMGEHLMDGNPPRPTLLALPAMAAAAGATRTIRVMTGIVIAPLYHPVLLAKTVATIDVVSGGRLDFGIGISGQRGTQVEFEAVGVPVRTRGRRTNEMMALMKRLWTEEHVNHHGEFFDIDDVTLTPRPVQQPHPPMWVAGRSDAAMRRAALLGDGWYPYLFTVRRLGQTNETIRQIAAKAGRDLTGFNWGLNQPTAISTDGKEALAMAEANVGERYVTPRFSVQAVVQAFCVAGTPQDCVKGIEDRVEAGAREINLAFLADDAQGLYQQMELFASRVMPHFRT